MLTAQPGLMGYDVETHLRPLVHYLKALGIEVLSFVSLSLDCTVSLRMFPVCS